jgi:adenylate cyclase class 2
VVIDHPDKRMQINNDGWIRIRDEGDKITLTFKQSEENEFGGAKEIEVSVSDYKKTIDIFLSLGMTVHSDQETKRESWLLNNVQIELDEWPWLNPFIEIEANSEEEVKSTAENLGFKWDDVQFGSVIVAYEKQYPKVNEMGIKISSEPKINFDLPKPEWLKEK